MMLLLAISCQKDESADIDADGGQPSTEVSPRQLQIKAREITNSMEYQNLMDQVELLTNKIYDGKNFFTEDIYNVETGSYNRDLIRERLSMTSFKSVDEFIHNFTDLATASKQLGAKYYEDIQNQSLRNEINRIDEEIYFRSYDEGYTKCVKRHDNCIRKARNDFGFGLAMCCISGLGGPICAVPCHIANSYAYYRAEENCDDNYRECRGWQ